MSTVGLMILAAGASTRMGTAKQLLPFRGRSLLRSMVEEAAACCDSVVVVLGAQADRIKLEIDGEIHTVENQRWAEGMGTSIQAGMGALLTLNQTLEAVLITLCDQPFVTAQLLRQLIASYQATQSPIIASAYANTLGVPALFDRSLFTTLMTLSAGAGAKDLIKQHAAKIDHVPFPRGAIDLDTPAQYQQLLREN